MATAPATQLIKKRERERRKKKERESETPRERESERDAKRLIEREEREGGREWQTDRERAAARWATATSPP
jgi:hypothetical protein